VGFDGGAAAGSVQEGFFGYAKSDGAFPDLMQQAMEHFRMRAEK
jgi:hypothetical protein